MCRFQLYQYVLYTIKSAQFRNRTDGLTVDPCIPSTLDGFEAKRDFRGVTYHISVRNPKHVEKGVASMTVDGVAVDGNTIPLPTGKTEVSVEVVMG